MVTYDEMLPKDIVPILNICKLNQISLTADDINRYNKRGTMSVQPIKRTSYKGGSQVIGFTIHKEGVRSAKIYHIGAHPDHVEDVLSIVLGDLQSHFDTLWIIVPENNLFLLKAIAHHKFKAELLKEDKDFDNIKFTWERVPIAKAANVKA
jgi:hypothetical protein